MRTGFTEHDIALLHALQIAPRAEWAELSGVLGSTPSTLAGRWERLREAGLAWLTVYPTVPRRDVTTALIEIELEPRHRAEAVAALCRDPRASTVEETAAGRDLIVTSFAQDHAALTEFVLDDLPRFPGVGRVRTHLVTEVHVEGADWRLDGLEPGQQEALRAHARKQQQPWTQLPPQYRPIVRTLTEDGRASAARIARAIDRNPATVRRQLARLLASDLLSFRCEIARLPSRWPVVCTWFAQVPAGSLERTVRSLRTIPELRLCLSVSGKANLLFIVWARSVNDLARLERRMSEKLPWLTLVESTLTLRMPKRMGWLLDEYGRNTGEFIDSGVFRED